MTSPIQSSNAARLKPVMQIDTNWRSISAALAWSPNRSELAVAGFAAIRLIGTGQTDPQPRILKGHESDIASIAYSPDGNYLASGGADTHIQLWDMNTFSPLLVLSGHTDFVSSVAFSPDGIHIASAGRDDATVRIWNRKLSSQESILKHSDTESVLCAIYNYDGKIVASGGQDGVLYLWDAGIASLLTTLEGHSACITSIAFHPYEKILASADFDGAVMLWDTETYKQRSFLHHA
jgi:WD40 repeat protein